jgi:hypothetical protein
MLPPVAQHETICGTSRMVRSKRSKSAFRWPPSLTSTKTAMIGTTERVERRAW